MNNIEQTAIFWLIKEEEGLSVFEKKQLEKWLEDDPLNKEEYEINKRIRSAFKTLPKNMKEELKQKANNGILKIRRFQKLKYFGFAAMILLSIGFGSLKFYESLSPIYTKNLISSTQLINKQILPDSSMIALDVHSNMKVDFYKNKRAIELKKGRAMFYIAKDKKRPFIIRTAKTQIEVIGTSFEVSNIKDFISIKVKEGIVKVFQEKGSFLKAITFLKKGDSIFLDRQGDIIKLGKIKIETIANWEKGFFVFSNTPLVNAVKKFSRYNDINIEYENEHVAYTSITGKFSINEFDKFLEALPKIYPLKLQKNKNNLKILEN